MTDFIKRFSLCVVFTTAAAAASSTFAATDKIASPPTVSEEDQIQFTQKDVQAQMQELQDRMFHLADISKETEPDNATRLLLAVRKAREQLIIEQMNDVLDKLTRKDLTSAAADTKEVLTKLAELKNLLITTDLDLQLQLERLHKLQAAIRELDNAIKSEQEQKAQTSALAALQKQGTNPKPGELKNAQAVQGANRKRTDGVNDAVKALGNLDQAVKPLTASSQSMANAEGNLGSGKPGDALTMQGDATQKLQEARAALEQERQKVLEELSRQVKRVVIQNLQEMLQRQTAVRQANESLAPRLDTDREALLQLERLAPPEQRIAAICQQTLDLVNETEFSVALPSELESLEKNMLYVSGDLTAGRGNEPVLAAERGIEQDLHDLIETFQEMPPDSQTNSRCNGCKGNMNKLLAELKVVRLMQTRVNKGTLTANADARHAAAANQLPQELRDQIGKLRDGQDAVHFAMDRLHDRFTE